MSMVEININFIGDKLKPQNMNLGIFTNLYLNETKFIKHDHLLKNVQFKSKGKTSFRFKLIIYYCFFL